MDMTDVLATSANELLRRKGVGLKVLMGRYELMRALLNDNESLLKIVVDRENAAELKQLKEGK